MGPGVQTEIRDPVVLETCEGPGCREAERGQTIKSLQNRWDPTLFKTVRDFQRVSAQGSLTVDGWGVRRREALSAGKEAMGRFPAHVPL